MAVTTSPWNEPIFFGGGGGGFFFPAAGLGDITVDEPVDGNRDLLKYSSAPLPELRAGERDGEWRREFMDGLLERIGDGAPSEGGARLYPGLDVLPCVVETVEVL